MPPPGSFGGLLKLRLDRFLVFQNLAVGDQPFLNGQLAVLLALVLLGR